MPSSWQAAASIFLSFFLAVVSSSFAFGIFLLQRGPRPVPAARAVAATKAREENVAAQLRAGNDHLQRGDVEQAILAYRRTLALAPSVEGQLGLAEGERRAGREQIAAREFERVLVLEPRNAVALRQLARLYSGQASTWQQSEDRYREYVAVAPTDSQAQLELGRLLLWQRKAAEAVALLSQHTVQALMSPEDRRDYALALVKAGRSGDAEPLLEALAAGDDDVAVQVAGLRAARGEWDSALPLYRAVLDRRPDDPQANLGYGAGLLARKDYGEALRPLGKAARALPDSAEAGLFYARALRGTGSLKSAAAEFARVFPKYEKDAAVSREYADLLAQRGDYGGAEEQYRRLLAMDQRDDPLLVSLAGVLSANGKPREAIPLLERVHARQPSQRLAYDLARLYQRVGQNDRAREMLKTIERNSSSEEH